LRRSWWSTSEPEPQRRPAAVNAGLKVHRATAAGNPPSGVAESARASGPAFPAPALPRGRAETKSTTATRRACGACGKRGTGMTHGSASSRAFGWRCTRYRVSPPGAASDQVDAHLPRLRWPPQLSLWSPAPATQTLRREALVEVEVARMLGERLEAIRAPCVLLTRAEPPCLRVTAPARAAACLRWSPRRGQITAEAGLPMGQGGAGRTARPLGVNSKCRALRGRFSATPSVMENDIREIGNVERHARDASWCQREIASVNKFLHKGASFAAAARFLSAWLGRVMLPSVDELPIVLSESQNRWLEKRYLR
jgi:hypothetical protein